MENYKIDVTHRQESKDGEEVRNDIVIYKTNNYLLGHGSITIPTKYLPELIEQLQNKLQECNQTKQ